MVIGATVSGNEPLARRMARSALAVELADFGPDVVAKAKLCLIDFLSCAFEAVDHPWSRQAIAAAHPVSSGATIIGISQLASPADSAFANAVMGHGLVREDMHAASISHHGVVIWPTLLALSEQAALRGTTLLAAAIIGYEAGARIGRALFNSDLARLYRPTGLVAPLGAALAGSFALGLSEQAATSAIAIAANTSSGLNEWPRVGGSEMYFHPGFAAANALRAIALAEAGALASETILEGEAGLFAAYRRQRAPDDIQLFGGEAEIMAVYNKPAPACNFAQTASQAALRVSYELSGTESVERIIIRAPGAAVRYPGCDAKGPYRNALQAKMSIPFSVAATLARGEIDEENYASLQDPEILRLIEVTDLESDAAFTAAFPAKQGADVIIHLRDGKTIKHSLSDVVAATPAEIRSRFRAAAARAIGEDRARRLEQAIDGCEQLGDAGVIAAACRLDPPGQILRTAS
jgi:2-methylcitrate dehydratase PrpD